VEDVLPGLNWINTINPFFFNGRPKWVRPVSRAVNHEVDTNLVRQLSLLDIFEIEAEEEEPTKHQVENIYFDEFSFNIIERFPVNDIDELIDNQKINLVFGNRGTAILPDKAGTLAHSLILLKITDFKMVIVDFDDRPYSKKKLNFSFNSNEYTLPITDPVFLFEYFKNKEILVDIDKIYACVSLGLEHEGWCHKLVAGIVY